MAHRSLRPILALLKIVLPVGLIVWLLVTVGRNNPEIFTELLSGPKRWDLLLMAFVCSLAAVSVTFFRWYLLVRAVGLSLRVRDVFRLGCLGYLLNFVGLGSVGGDLFKAIFIAREQPGRRTEAIATVVVDRLFGMYGLFAFVTIALTFSNVASISDDMQTLARTVYICTAMGTLVVAVVLMPGFTTSSVWESLTALPRIGPTIGRLVAAMRMFRRSTGVLIVSTVASISVYALFTLSIWFAANGLFVQSPTLSEHAVIVPLSLLVGAIPIAPAGFGTYELGMTFLYDHVPAGGVGEGKGLVVALCYRIITIAIAGIGMVYYWFGRKEVREILHEAKLEN